jgi:hypothetical protein
MAASTGPQTPGEAAALCELAVKHRHRHRWVALRHCIVSGSSGARTGVNRERNDRLWLESLEPHVRAYILRERLAAVEREAWARAILDAERRAGRDGMTRPAEQTAS